MGKAVLEDTEGSSTIIVVAAAVVTVVIVIIIKFLAHPSQFLTCRNSAIL